MATRASPRSNASSASSSSTSSSRRAYRNPSFAQDRDSRNLDAWASSGRSAYAGKQLQHENRGQWGQKHHQARKDWGNSGTPIAEESQSRLPWRSQKQASKSRMDSGRPLGAQDQNGSSEASPFPPQGQSASNTPKGRWNRGNPNGKSFHAHQQHKGSYEALPFPPQDQFTGHTPPGRWNRANPPSFDAHQRKPGLHSEQPRWENYQSNSTKQNHFTPDKFTHEISNPPGSDLYHNQEYMSCRNTHSNNGSLASTLSHNPGVSDTALSCQQGFRDDPVNFNRGSEGYSGQFRQGSGQPPGSSIAAVGGGAALQRTQVTHRGWEGSSAINRGGLGTKFDDFPPLTTRDKTGQGSIEAASAPRLAPNRAWAGMGAITGSWADECSDDGPQTYEVKVGSVDNMHREDWESAGVAILRRPNVSTNSHNRHDTSVADRDRWRQNSQQSLNVSVVTETSIHSPKSGSKQRLGLKQGQASRSTSISERSVKHSTFIASDERAGKAGNISKDRVSTQKEARLVGNAGDEEPLTCKDQVSAPQADVEVSDELMLPFIIGTCEDMCPLKERQQRERLRDLAVFERVNRNPSKTSRELAVKKFCRTFTGVKLLSDDVRPLCVLWNTLQYLLNLLDDSEFPFDVVHNFLFDRTRAIRQELGMQRIANSQAINMYEEIVRFHILSEHELNQRSSARHLSDSHLNLQQLSKSLLSLFDLYRLNRKEKLANEAEFRAYYILLNLDSNSNYQADSLSVWFRQCPTFLLKTWELKFAQAVLRCYRLGNYKAFFKLVQEATFLQSCLMELHFSKVRLQTLMAMNQGGYKLHPIPLADIARELLMKEGDLEELCNLCGLSTGMDTSRVRCFFVKLSQFSAPKELPSYRCPCIISKQPSSYYEEVTGLRQRQ